MTGMLTIIVMLAFIAWAFVGALQLVLGTVGALATIRERFGRTPYLIVLGLLGVLLILAGRYDMNAEKRTAERFLDGWAVVSATDNGRSVGCLNDPWSHCNYERGNRDRLPDAEFVRRYRLISYGRISHVRTEHMDLNGDMYGREPINERVKVLGAPVLVKHSSGEYISSHVLIWVETEMNDIVQVDFE